MTLFSGQKETRHHESKLIFRTGRLIQMTDIRNSAIRNKDSWGDQPMRTFDYCSYQALSSAAVNPIAYIFLPRGETPKDRNWRPESAWEQTEFWALTKNPNIQKIIRVDPRPPDVLGISHADWCRWSEEQVLWERGVDEEVGPVWQCPVYYDANGDPM